MQSTAVVQNSASGIQFHILSFEGPDGYARAGGIAIRITGLSEALADAGFDTHLWFVGDPDRPGHENSELLWRHRWCQWISQYHPAGVYDGEEGKRADSAASLPPFLLHEVLLPHLQPPAVFSELPPPANYFRFRVTPNLIIAIGALVKKAGDHTEGQQVELVISAKNPIPPKWEPTKNSFSMPCGGIRSVSRVKTTSNRRGALSIRFWTMRLCFTLTTQAPGGPSKRTAWASIFSEPQRTNSMREHSAQVGIQVLINSAEPVVKRGGTPRPRPPPSPKTI